MVGNDKIIKKIKKLGKIYTLYDQIVKDVDMSCKKGCASCCTCNVTMTGMEAAYIFKYLEDAQKQQMITAINEKLSLKRYQPKLTTNMFAKMIVEGKEPEEEENDPSWGKCPLLIDNACSIYEVRPFGCRNMLSSHDCSQKGFAQISEWILTVNNVFLQYIEHLDQDGFTANLSDILLLLTSKKIKDFYDIQTSEHFAQYPIVKNFEISTLLVPNSHQQKIKPVLNQISYIIND